MSPRKFTLLSRAQTQAIELLRTLTELQTECTNVNGRDFNVVCRSIDELQDINGELHQLQAVNHG